MAGIVTSELGAAIFIDIENMIGHCATLGLPVLINPICDKTREIAPLRFRRAFGDITKACTSINSPNQILALRKELGNNAIEIHDIPYVVNQKNSTDIQIVTTALSLAYENSNLSHFIFVSTDRDYVPLYSKLKEIGKVVVVIAIDELKTSSVILEVVDNLFYYEKILAPRTINFKSDDSHDNAELREEYINLVLRACKILQNERASILASDLPPKIKQLQADFDLSRIGIYQLKDFLIILQEKNYIKMYSAGCGPVEIELLKTALHQDVAANTFEPAEHTLSPDEIVVAYRRALEHSIKVPFPSLETRRTILLFTEKLITPYSSLIDSSNKILKAIKESSSIIIEHDSIVYKTLLSLFFARAFHVQTDPGNRNNPIIIDLRYNSTDLFDLLTVNYVSTLMRNSRFPEINPEALSKLIFEDTTESHIALCNAYIDEAKDSFKGSQRSVY